MMFKAPIIYFPSTTIFLDDDSLYSRMLIARLGMDNLKHFGSAEFLLKQKDQDFLFINSDLSKTAQLCDTKYVKQNLEIIRKSGNLISVLVSDLLMEPWSGLEILSQISSPHIGRILISNFIDFDKPSEVTREINQARNEGHIDIVLDKTQNLTEKLLKAITSARIKFFTSLSNALFSDLGAGHPFGNAEFAKFFISKIEELKPHEIIPNTTLNKFLFSFDSLRPNLVLHITEKNEIHSFLNSSGAENAPKEVLDSLAKGKYMLCHEEDSVLLDGSLWPLYVRPAKEFTGRNINVLYNFSEAQPHDQQ